MKMEHLFQYEMSTIKSFGVIYAYKWEMYFDSVI